MDKTLKDVKSKLSRKEKKERKKKRKPSAIKIKLKGT